MKLLRSIWVIISSLCLGVLITALKTPLAKPGPAESNRLPEIIFVEAPTVSLAEKNPTLTIMGFAWLTSEYIARQVKKGNV